MSSLTPLKILKLAYANLMMQWDKEYDKVTVQPENINAQERLKRLNEELEEIQDLISKEERAEKLKEINEACDKLNN